MVALLLAALIFIAVPRSDSTQKHRDLQTSINDIDRAVRFASNEAVLRNTVVRLRLNLDEQPIAYVVEYGPAGNLPLPEFTEKASMSLDEEKAFLDRKAALNRQFTKVEEFEDIKHAIPETITILGVASTSQKSLFKEGDANIYFYPTGEKDGALLFFTSGEEIAYLEVAPFLSETNMVFEPLNTSSVAKVGDLLQTRMDEVYKEWISK